MCRRSRDAAHVVVERAASRGYCLVSGGARGIDIAAHRHALRLDMPQLVVLPCGPDRVYPPEFAACFDEIARRPYSGVLFGLPEGTLPSKGSFASRNRIVVSLAPACVVVQAATRSGSVGTGRLAIRREGSTCAVVLGSPGCEGLVAAGATSLGRADTDDFARRVDAWLGSLLGEGPWVDEPSAPWPDHLRWLRARLEGAPVQGLALDAFAQPLEALCALTEAQTLSLVVEASSGRYRLA